MSRFTRLVVVTLVAAAAALLSVHIVAAATGSGPANPPSNMPPRVASYAGPGDSSPTPAAVSSASSTTNTPNSGDQEANEPQGQDAQEQQLTGTVGSLDSGRGAFTLSTAGGTITVITSAQTEFKDGLASPSDLRPGMTVTVDGARQSDGTVVASETKGSVDGPENDGQNNSQSESSTPDSNG